jgi:hypothetical protein
LTCLIPAFKPAISDFAKKLKREGKVEDRLMLILEEKHLKEEESKLEVMEKELEQKKKAQKLAANRNPKAMYDKCSMQLNQPLSIYRRNRPKCRNLTQRHIKT